ncbi:MAG: sigma-54-dependent Fis family transcriptional regulator [Myxococcales bacterium]|nr:sigma-54-dependent Fis family transcriptional regulator [Myxococcales bacterium]
MKTVHLVLVRPDPQHRTHNHPKDIDTARHFAQHPPCWVLLIGEAAPRKPEVRDHARSARLAEMQRSLGLSGIAEDGLTAIAPTELAGEDDADALARQLAHYLANVGLRMPLKQGPALDVHLPADLDPALVAAATEAVTTHARTDLWLGERRLGPTLRWETRRDLFQAPPPAAKTDLVGASPALEKVREKVARYADQPFPVLIIGETGTGKEVVATMLHEQSGRRGRFMAQNAAQLPPELADSLLFGHSKGAFTGADTDRSGRIREADGGTFFLDEAFNLAPSVQGKLLRALNRVEEGVILVEPVGSSRPPVIVHGRLVVSALGDPRRTQDRDGLSAMRTDLFYRVSAGIIRLPPLRQTLDDLPQLCPALLRRIGRGDIRVTADGVAALREHDWPGNVRELRLILVRALIDAPSLGDELGADAIRAALATNRLPPAARALRLPCDLDRELKRIEVATLRAARREAGGVQARAGRLVGMDPKSTRNFGRRLAAAEKSLDIDHPDDPEELT